MSACPSCGPTTAVQLNSEFFKCHKCDAGGRAHSFVAYHLFDRPWRDLSRSDKAQARKAVHLPAGAPAYRPPTEATQEHRWLRADSLWTAFEQSRSSGLHPPNAEAHRWLTERLAGDDQLATTLLQHQPPVVAAPDDRAPIRRWWNADYALAAPLYVWDGPQKGRIADLKPRWCGDGPPPNDLKEPHLSSKKTRAAGLVRFFGNPAHVTWATQTILVLEGGADYMTGEALRLGGLLPKHTSVIAVPGASQGANLGRCLAEHLLELNQRYANIAGKRDPWRVIIATDTDTAGDRGGDAVHAQLRLHGAPVDVCRPDWPTGIDLGDRIEQVGIPTAAAELTAAPSYQPPAYALTVPKLFRDSLEVALEDAGETLRDTLSGLLKSAREAKTRHVLAVPPGMGKTTAVLQLILERAKGNRALPQLIVALPSWSSVREKRDQLEDMAQAAGVVVHADELVGISEGCQDAIHNGYPIKAKTAYDKAGHPLGWRRDVCPKCPLQPTCRSHRHPSMASDVLFTVHAMLTRLRADSYKNFVVVTDEAAEPVQIARFQVEHLRAPDDATLGAAWEVEHTDAVDRLDAWRSIRDLLSDVIAKSPRGRHALHLSGTKLAKGLLKAAHKRGGDAAIASLLRDVKIAASVDPADLPAPDTYQLLRTGQADSRILVRRDLPLLYQALSALLEGDDNADSARDDAPMLHCVIPPKGQAPKTFAFELRRPTPLPDGLGVVALDATATLTPHLHEAYLGGPVEVTRIAVRPDPNARVVRIHVPQRGLSRGRLLPWGAPGQEALTRISRLINQAVAHAHAFAGETFAPQRAALLTYLPLAQALDRDIVAGPLDMWHRAVRRMASKEVTWGYYGGNARASNAFEGVEMLVTLGDPWPNLGARRATLQAMGLDEETIAQAIQGEVDAELSQAHGRARAERRAGVTVQVHIGARMPESWRGLPVHTAEVSAPELGRPEGPKAVQFEAALVDLAEQLKVVTPRLVTQLLSKSVRSDINSSVSLLAQTGCQRDSKRLLATLARVAGIAPMTLPSESTRRRVIARVMAELGWRQVGRAWVAPAVNEQDGMALLTYLHALTKGQVVAPPADAMERHWWWLAEALDDYLLSLALAEAQSKARREPQGSQGAHQVAPGWDDLEVDALCREGPVEPTVCA